ncbi:MAG: MerR family transcriptional regulator [Chloroflexi bacterium]|nr:MerR family transcriptional regulator [Chloroflexota bacterium]
MEQRLTIGRLAELAGVPRKTIRYYEEVGVLPPPNRSDAGYRLYSDIDVRRVELVRRARALDMGLSEVRELVEWATTGSCNDFQERFHEVLHCKLAEVDERISDLGHLKDDLQRLGAHFAVSQKEADAGHTVLECSPETCTCLGAKVETPNQLEEVKLWLNRSESKK